MQATDVVNAANGIEKAAGDDKAKKIVAAADVGRFKQAEPEIRDVLTVYAKDRAEAAARSVAGKIGASAEDLDRMLSQANENAIAWAERHAATLVTEVSRTTKDEIRELVTVAMQEGATNEELAKSLGESFAFSPERSMMIARTETAFADERGTLQGWRASGEVEEKAWLPDVDPCPVCQANAAQGPIPVDAEFQSGDLSPPAHPNCECSMTAVLRELDP